MKATQFHPICPKQYSTTVGEGIGFTMPSRQYINITVSPPGSFAWRGNLKI